MSQPQSRANIVVERTYRASLEDIWDLWTTKEGFESWWGPEGFRADVHVLEAREGGLLKYDMVADAPEVIAAMEAAGQPTSHPTNSQFSAFKPRERLVITNTIDFLPGVPPYNADITVELFATGGEVRMVVTLDALHSEAFSNMQLEGFTSQLRKLEGRFGAA
jgi:uncharacterized protein YndB with AHSA1/START domain